LRWYAAAKLTDLFADGRRVADLYRAWRVSLRWPVSNLRQTRNTAWNWALSTTPWRFLWARAPGRALPYSLQRGDEQLQVKAQSALAVDDWQLLSAAGAGWAGIIWLPT